MCTDCVSPPERALAYLQEAGEDVLIGDQFALPDWSEDRLMRLLSGAEDRAAGLDGWAPRHWRHLTRAAVRWLVVLLTLVEAGAEWPRDALHGKAVFIGKPSTRWDDPLTWRVLLILPYLYRVWAKSRLADLEPWAAAWATPDMMALYPGTDATLAWYRSALYREQAAMQGRPYSGSCDDIWKCYDRVSRQLANMVACAAGFPVAVAQAYLRFHGRLEVRNSLPLGLGRPVRRMLAIPQGCPSATCTSACC